VPRLPLHPLDRFPGPGDEPGAVAQHVHGDALLPQLGRLSGDVLLQQLHQRRHLARGTLPVLLREREQGEDLDPRRDRSLHDLPHGFHPRAVPQRARQVPLPRPASVPVHDDRDVARHCAVEADPVEQIVGHAQTSRISDSLPFSTSSICFMCSSCSFCTSFSACFFSSSETCSVFLILLIPSVRAWRTATRPSSANLCTTFTSSRRRSSVSGGSGIRMRLPSLDGVSPRSDARIAFSTALRSALS